MPIDSVFPQFKGYIFVPFSIFRASIIHFAVMTATRVKRTIAILALIFVILGICAFYTSRRPEVWNLVNASMTRQQVYAFLGPPDIVSTGQSNVTWRKVAWSRGHRLQIAFGINDQITGITGSESWGEWPPFQ